MLTERFRNLYEPGENLCIDESIIGFRGRAPFRVFMPAKPKKFGLKVWTLADPKTKYVWNMQLYTGKPAQESEAGLGEKVIILYLFWNFYLGRN